MKLRYETAVTTFAQLAVVSLFIIIGGVVDTIKACDEASSCVASSFVWMAILLFMAGWFIALTALGYFAQTKRSARLAKLLIIAELGVAAICFKLVTTPSSWIGAMGAGITLALALWTIVLAYRLTKAKGGRIVAQTRNPKTRPRSPRIAKP